MPLFYWGAQNWAQHSRCVPPVLSRTTILHLLVMLFLMCCRMSVAAFALKVCYWLMSPFLSTRTLSTVSAELLSTWLIPGGRTGHFKPPPQRKESMAHLSITFSCSSVHSLDWTRLTMLLCKRVGNMKTIHLRLASYNFSHSPTSGMRLAWGSLVNPLQAAKDHWQRCW